MPHLVWITGRSLRHQQSARRAAPAGVRVTMLRNPSPAERSEHLPTTDIIISERRGRITTDLLDLAPHLKLIVRLGSLTDDIDLAACQQRGIIVSRQPVAVAIAVAEHLMLQILALLKHLNEVQYLTTTANHNLPPERTDENTFQYNWSRFRKIERMMGKTIAIIGMGEIGVELTRRLSPFLPEAVLYHKRTPYSREVESILNITYASFDESIARADILVNLLPYSPETDLILNAEVFQRMKPGSLLAHAGSGSTIQEQDLIMALRDGHLAGAALDTYEYEPLPPDHPLITAAKNPALNLILTPHIAAGTGSPDRSSDYAEVIRFLAGEPLHYRIV